MTTVTTSMSDRDLEAETIIRWDRETDAAVLYTADPAEMRRWRRLGYAVEVRGLRAGRPSGWQATVPVAAVALLPLRAGEVRAPRWLEYPTLADRAENGRQARGPGKTGEITQEIRTEFPAAKQTATG